MSLFVTACEIAKGIVRSPSRAPINAALVALGLAPGERGEPADEFTGAETPGPLLGYLSRGNNLHFRSVLLYDKAIRNDDPSLRALGLPLEHLSDELWARVSEGDLLIEHVLTKIGDVVQPHLSGLDPAWHPYWGRVTPDYPANAEAPPELCESLAPSIEAMIRQVENHPTLTVRDWEPLRSVDLPTELPSFETDVYRIAEAPRPRDVALLAGRDQNQTGEEQRRFHQLSALFALRQSILNVATLLYTSFRFPRIVAFDGTNTYSVSGQVDALGTRARTGVQPAPGNSILDVDVGDVVLFAPPEGSSRLPTSPAVVMTMDQTLSNQTGVSVEFDLRLLSEWLHPFAGLTAT